MRLDGDFRMALPVEDAWTLLTDLPRVAPFVPGARIDEAVDGEYRGGMTTTGTSAARYACVARFLDRDDVARRLVVEVRGAEDRGDGVAAGTIEATLEAEEDGTRVNVSTDLAVTGRTARLGRSALAEANTGMLAELARRLAADGSSAADEEPVSPERAPRSVRRADTSERPREPVQYADTAARPRDASGIVAGIVAAVRPARGWLAVAAGCCLTGVAVGWLTARHRYRA